MVVIGEALDGEAIRRAVAPAAMKNREDLDPDD